MKLLQNGLKEWRATRRSAKIVGKSGFWTCVLNFLAVFPTRYAEPAGIISKLRWKFCIMGLEVCRSDSVKRIWEIPVKYRKSGR